MVVVFLHTELDSSSRVGMPEAKLCSLHITFLQLLQKLMRVLSNSS